MTTIVFSTSVHTTMNWCSLYKPQHCSLHHEYLLLTAMLVVKSVTSVQKLNSIQAVTEKPAIVNTKIIKMSKERYDCSKSLKE